MLVSPPIYLWYFCVSMSLLPFDLKSWPLMKRTRDNVLGYLWQAWSWYMLQSLQNALFGYFIQECSRYLMILFTCPGQSTCLCRRLNPWSLKFVILLNQWLKQPATVRSRYLAVTLLPITHVGLIARPPGRGMGVRELQMWPKFYVRSLGCMQYRDISRVYCMFLWLTVFWRYEWRFMG